MYNFKKTLFAITTAGVIATTTSTGAAALSIEVPAEYVRDNPVYQELLNAQKDTQNKLHEFAELARELGYEEDSDVIKDAQAQWAEAQEQIDNIVYEMNCVKQVIVTYNPHMATGLSAKAFDEMLAGTDMAGTGESFAKMEAETGTNGLFAIGVANSESTLGKHCYNNNPFGILTSGKLKAFSSWDEAIMYFGNLIAGNLGVKSYAYAHTIEQINNIYCPGDNYYWTSKVKATIDSRLQILA